ncbi:hypothetical protein ACWEOZ_10685 [Actinoplanes sp. NPDC004185]
MLVNDTAEPFRGTFTVTRESFDATVLAEATLEASVPARGAATLTIPAGVAAFGDPASEVIVAVPADGTAGFGGHRGRRHDDLAGRLVRHCPRAVAGR